MDIKLIDESLDNGAEDDVRQFGRSSADETSPISPDHKADDLARSERRTLIIIIISTIVFSIALTIGLVVQCVMQTVEVPLRAGVSTTSTDCTAMAQTVLNTGGSAVDAAIVATLCLGVVRPEVTGIGGGGFMVILRHKTHDAATIDFREASPSNISSYMSNNVTLQPSAISGLEWSGASVGVPGTIAGLYLAHQQYGKLSWSALVQPAAALARSGFILSSSTVESISRRCSQPALCHLPAYLLDSKGQLLEAGATVVRSSYANALDLIATSGPEAVYGGSIADDIVQSAHGSGPLRGSVSRDDLAKYSAINQSPASIEFNGYKVLSTQAPSAGPAALHALGILSYYNWTVADMASALTYHRTTEALNFCNALFSTLGDPAFDPLIYNTTALALDRTHCKMLWEKIKDTSALEVGSYFSDIAGGQGIASSTENSMYSRINHVSAVDSDELYVSAETSLGSDWGSFVITKKYDIVLNNAMMSFGTGANTVDSAKRPRSIASPVIFYSSALLCRKRGTVGSSGSQSTISGTVQALLNLLSFDVNPSLAVTAPRVNPELFPLQKVFYEEPFSAATVMNLSGLHQMKNVSSIDNTISVLQKIDNEIAGASDTSPSSISYW